jgi:hypothetical protein
MAPPPPPSIYTFAKLTVIRSYPPQSLPPPVRSGKLFAAMPVVHGAHYSIKGVERLGRPHRFLDAVPHVDNRPGSGYAVGSRSDSAFRQCVLHTSMRIVPPSEAFLKLRFFDWLQSSSSWGVAPPAISSHDWRCTRPLGVIRLAMRRHSLTKPV